MRAGMAMDSANRKQRSGWIVRNFGGLYGSSVTELVSEKESVGSKQMAGKMKYDSHFE
jgi:hypothetical protein